MALVGFFDILGTKEAVMADRFSDLTALDFAGPASVAAKFFPAIRVAIFSDSVIVSAEKGSEIDFLRAIALMYGQWWADFILVRGGIASGEIRWVDYEAVDKTFRNCPNLMCARVYGKGLVLAHELEQRAGPGAIPYLTEQAASILSKVEKNCVLPGVSTMLCWATKQTAELLNGYAQINLEHNPKESAARRHGLATKHYWEQVLAHGKYLPEELDIFCGPSRRRPNKAFQRDKVAVSHLLQKAQKLRHSNFAPEQRR